MRESPLNEGRVVAREAVAGKVGQQNCRPLPMSAGLASCRRMGEGRSPMGAGAGKGGQHN